MLSYLKISDYCNFNNFEIYFDKGDEEKHPNLNILIGRNGSGKSSLLDALFQIGENNLKNRTDMKVDNTNFDYNFKLVENSTMYSKSKKNEEGLWDLVIRLYTGNTERQNKSENDNVLSLTVEDTKWALSSLFLSGVWNEEKNKPDDINGKSNLVKQIQNLMLGENPEDKKAQQIEPKIIWLETNIDFKNDEVDEQENLLVNIDLPPYDFKRIVNGKFRYYWKIETLKKDEKELFQFFIKSLQKRAEKEKLKKEDDKLIFCNTGFLFTKSDNNELLPSQSLSDGELGFLERFALLMILRDYGKEPKEEKGEQKKALILLDEPETHFNEHWKSYFLKMVDVALRDTKHDVFISTHSAMLASDAKNDELHRLQNYQGKTVCFPNPINTFGANIIDIGQILFKMEGDIGHRAKDEIEKALKLKGKNTKKVLEDLLKTVGAGEYRWRIRAKLQQLEKQDSCENFECKGSK